MLGKEAEGGPKNDLQLTATHIYNRTETKKKKNHRHYTKVKLHHL